MSGIEIAGLVLGAYPIAIWMLDEYRQGFETLSDWFSFRTEFLAFIHTVERESTLYEENLEELLGTLVETEQEVAVLLDDPNGEAWRQLDRRLSERMPKGLKHYLRVVGEINHVLKKLLNKMGIQEGKASWAEARSSFTSKLRWEKEFKRIKFALGRKKRERLTVALREHNETLQRILCSSDRLAPLRQRRAKIQAASYTKIRERAASLYTALRSAWQCNTSAVHETTLMLRPRLSKGEGYVATIAIIEQDEFQLVMGCYCHGSSNGILCYGARIVAEETSLVELSHQASDISVTSSLATLESKMTASIEQVTSLDDKAWKSHRRKDSGKELKHVKFASKLPSTETTNDAANDTTSVQPIADLCSALTLYNSGRLFMGHVIGDARYRHKLETVFSYEHDTRAARYITLDEILKHSSNQDTSFQISRRERFQTAVILASSILQLHRTSWIRSLWSSQDIIFLKAREEEDNCSFDVTKPFVLQGFRSADKASAKGAGAISCFSSPHEDTREVLLRLGIVLLELCFGKRLQDQPFWQQYLGPSGQPTDYTDRAAASKWQKDVLAEGGEQFSDAIRRCLDCAFGPVQAELTNSDFAQAVYDGVVYPLYEAVRLAWGDM